jgi:lipopolysaccharide biosynthesis glycosyltransferase
MTYELHALTALGLQLVKIRATELFPELGGRLVYLDCDVIVQGTGSSLHNEQLHSL